MGLDKKTKITTENIVKFIAPKLQSECLEIYFKLFLECGIALIMNSARKEINPINTNS